MQIVNHQEILDTGRMWILRINLHVVPEMIITLLNIVGGGERDFISSTGRTMDGWMEFANM